jgi:uncharacterized OB-fold protein
MSSEPIERRVSYLGDRLRATRCQICGKEYFEIRDYCGQCGRKSFGKMADIDLFYEKGTLEVATLVNEPTNKFTKLGTYVYGIVSFHDGRILVPGRLTDRMVKREEVVDFSALEGRTVVPRFRRRYSVDPSDVIPTISLSFTIHIRNARLSSQKENMTHQESLALGSTHHVSGLKREAWFALSRSSTRIL